MANSISWGKIYETTWWGDKQNTASSLYPYATEDFNAPFDFQIRVEGDSGTFEGAYYLNNLILKLELI